MCRLGLSASKTGMLVDNKRASRGMELLSSTAQHSTWVQGWGKGGTSAQGVPPWPECQLDRDDPRQEKRQAEERTCSAAQHSTAQHSTWVQGEGEVGQAARPGGGEGRVPAQQGCLLTIKKLSTRLGLFSSTAPGCRAGEKWDKQHGVGVERAELVARTRDAVARGQQLGHVWHAATHIEHARPMLQVILGFTNRTSYPAGFFDLENLWGL